MAGSASATSEDSSASSHQLFLQLPDEENANVASAHHWTRYENMALASSS